MSILEKNTVYNDVGGKAEERMFTINYDAQGVHKIVDNTSGIGMNLQKSKTIPIKVCFKKCVVFRLCLCVF